MPFLDTVCRVTTATGRAYLVLQHATVFAVGRIGADARFSRGERALLLLLSEPEPSSILLEVLRCATLPGQLYSLLGLQKCRHEAIESLLRSWRQRDEKVSTQTGCFRSLQPVGGIVAQIEDGTYRRLLESHDPD
jgi:hypothetical protein